MPILKLKVKDDFRKFKEGDEFVFDTFKDERKPGSENQTRVLFLVGDNGCGKSTLMKAMRQFADTKRKSSFGNSELDGEMNVSMTSEIGEIIKHIDVEGFDYYQKVFAFDGEMDDNCRFEVASSATSYIDNGGYAMRFMSNGTRSIVSYIEFSQKRVKDNIVPGKTLILLDEVDRGWQIQYTALFTSLMQKHFPGCDVIVVSHNPLCWCSDLEPMYDVEDKKLCQSADEYFCKKTNWHIYMSVIDIFEMQKNISDGWKKKEEKYKAEIAELKKQLKITDNG